MNLDQFSDQLSVLVDSYRRFKDFDKKDMIDSLDFSEFDKSLFLTDAQEDLVREYYSGKGINEAFEESEETRRALAELVIHKEITVSDANPSSSKLTKHSYIFNLPEGLWYIVYEGAILDLEGSGACEEALNGIGEGAVIVPARYDELHYLLNNPFRGPKGNRVLRLDKSGNQVELVSVSHPIAKYVIRYIEQPSPIILTDLPENLNIRGLNTATECQLPTQLHQVILERAVANAVRSKLTARTQS
jgi:hypothetical protein